MVRKTSWGTVYADDHALWPRVRAIAVVVLVLIAAIVIARGCR